MITLTHDSDIIFADGTYRYTQRAGNRVQLQNTGTGEYLTLALTDIAARMTNLPAPTVKRHALGHLSPREHHENTVLATHVEEMISGKHPNFNTPRPQYDPHTTTQNERMQSKIVEMKAAGLPASRAHLYKLKQRYEKGGPAALIDGRTSPAVGPLDRADNRIIEAIGTVIAARTNKSTVSERTLHTLVRKELIATYKENAPAAPEQTLYRYFQLLGKNKYVTGKATTRRSTANSPKRFQKSTYRSIPGEEVQIDSTSLDIMVSTPDGPQRPILSIMVDVATRCIISSTVRYVGAKGYDHTLLLQRALAPRSVRPDATVHRALLSARYPQVTLLSEARRAELELTHPFIRPRRIMIDNGADYLSNVLKSACKEFEIDITESSIHTPTDKPFVERTFGSINTLFAEHLAGHAGNSTVNRGYKTDKGQLLDASMLNELFEDWVMAVWNHRPHEGLPDAFEPHILYSPIQKYNAAAEFAGSLPLPITRDQFISMLESVPRNIGPTGIQVFNRQYDSAELQPYRNVKSRSTRLNGKWDIKWNPFNPASVFVLSPDQVWIECRWRHSAIVDQPHFAEIQANLRAMPAFRVDLAQEQAFFSGTPFPATTPDPLDPANISGTFDWTSDDLNPDIIFDNFDPDKD